MIHYGPMVGLKSSDSRVLVVEPTTVLRWSKSAQNHRDLNALLAAAFRGTVADLALRDEDDPNED